MLDKKTVSMLDILVEMEKEANDQATSQAQYRERRTGYRKKYTGAGMGAGTAGGGATGAYLSRGLGRKWQTLATLGGAAAGAVAGKYMGDKGSSGVQRTRDVVIRKQQRKKGQNAAVPRLSDQSVQKMLPKK